MTYKFSTFDIICYELSLHILLFSSVGLLVLSYDLCFILCCHMVSLAWSSGGCILHFDRNKLFLTQELIVGSVGSYGQERQQQPPVSSVMPTVMPEYLAPHTQLELGQSIVKLLPFYLSP